MGPFRNFSGINYFRDWGNEKWFLVMIWSQSFSLNIRELSESDYNKICFDLFRKVKIHTISFNCNDTVANTFLQMLAQQSKGRYHKFQTEVDDAENLKNLLMSADSSSSSAVRIA